MCVETMDTRSKHIKSDYLLRKTEKPGPKLRWKLLRVSAGMDEAIDPPRLPAGRAAVRRYLRREQKRAQLAKLVQALGDVGRKELAEPVCEEGPAAACASRHPPGAMAPANTTQYLMSHVYEDLKQTEVQSVPSASAHLYGEATSPRSVYAALDSDYESCLAFQQRDFEEMFDLGW